MPALYKKRKQIVKKMIGKGWIYELEEIMEKNSCSYVMYDTFNVSNSTGDRFGSRKARTARQ